MSGVASGSLGHFTFPHPDHPDDALARRTVPSASPTCWSRITSPPCCAAPSRAAASVTATCSPVRAASARPPPPASSPWRSTAPTGTARGDPCGECENCRRIWSGAANLDVVEIDAASNRGVDDARELRERAMYAASQEGHYKVYIVDEAHMLTREAWNALLKILEEPPPRRGVRVRHHRAAEDRRHRRAGALPAAALRLPPDRPGRDPRPPRGRCSTPRGIAADDDALTLIARHADGGMRDALSRARPVPELRRGRGHRRPGARGARAGGGRARTPRLLALVAERRRRPASSRWWSGWSTRAPTWPSSWAARRRCSARC